MPMRRMLPLQFSLAAFLLAIPLYAFKLSRVPIRPLQAGRSSTGSGQPLLYKFASAA
jgi:hypothetical protein